MSMGLSMLTTVLGLLLAAGIFDAAPYQELEPRAGYVPVYIREGDTPLSEINYKLAEAFNEPSDGYESDKMLISTDDSNLSKPINDQVMSEDQVVEEVALEPIDNSSQEPKEDADKAKEPNTNVADAAKEVIKELVSVFETEMLEKLGLDEGSNKAKADNKNTETKVQKDESKVTEGVKSSEKQSDVLTVEDFKAKDFNKESIDGDTVNTPPEVPSEQ